MADLLRRPDKMVVGRVCVGRRGTVRTTELLSEKIPFVTTFREITDPVGYHFRSHAA